MQMSYFHFYKTALRRELLMALRRLSDVANPLMFFVLVVALFPLGIGPDPKQLAQFAPGILWIVALLASLLATDGIFQSDYQDGSLEQMLISPLPLMLMVLAKVTAHWLLTGLPLTLISPLMALLLQLPTEGMLALMASLAIGTGVLSLLGAIGAGLTVGLKRGGVLVSLLILPLYIPVLIFGSGAVQAAVQGFAYQSHLAVLGGFLCIAVALAPFAISAGVRISVEN
jgi:heme exporter protein B